MTISQKDVATLIEAYHVLFDAKDAERAGSLRFGELADHARNLAVAMVSLGVEPPRRFDGDGRTVANGGLPA